MLGSLAKRFVRVSNRGIADQIRRELEPEKREKAQKSVAVGDLITDTLNRLPAKIPEYQLERARKKAFGEAVSQGLVENTRTAQSNFKRRWILNSTYRYGDVYQKAGARASRAEKKRIEEIRRRNEGLARD